MWPFKSQDDITAGHYDSSDASNVLQLDYANQRSDQLLDKYRSDPNSLSVEEQTALANYMAQYYDEMQSVYGTEMANDLTQSLLTEGSNFRSYAFPYALDDESKDAAMQNWEDSNDYSAWDSFWSGRPLGEDEQAYLDAETLTIATDQQQWETSMGDGVYVIAGASGVAAGTVRGTMITAGTVQTGTGIVQGFEGDYSDAAINVMSGLLNLGGAWAGANIAKQPATTVTADLTGLGKTSTSVVDDVVDGLSTIDFESATLTPSTEALKRIDFDQQFTGRFATQAESDVAYQQYQLAKNTESELVIGRTLDTEMAPELGMTHLDVGDVWTPSINEAFIQGGIDAKKPFYLGSSPQISNYRHAWDILERRRVPYPNTVFFTEMKQLRDAGYRLIGDYMLPPN